MEEAIEAEEGEVDVMARRRKKGGRKSKKVSITSLAAAGWVVYRPTAELLNSGRDMPTNAKYAMKAMGIDTTGGSAQISWADAAITYLPPIGLMLGKKVINKFGLNPFKGIPYITL